MESMEYDPELEQGRMVRSRSLRSRLPSLSFVVSSSSTLSSGDDTTNQANSNDNNNNSTTSRSARSSAPRIRIRAQNLPIYTIDLSSPPSERYTAICADFLSELTEFTHLYRAVLDVTGFPKIVGAFAKALLRRVWAKEEEEEIRGIARCTGLPLHEVVAFNTFLDLFSGCVSGGVRYGGEDGSDAGNGVNGKEGGRMLHFRGLDWEMDSLRDLLVRVEYVRDGKIVARAVTYAGYVGALTGVREGLSISMNYRLRVTSRKSVFSHRIHQLLLLLGFRPSISSQLRQLLLSPGPAPSLDEIRKHFDTTTTSPCYLTFCSPDEVMVIEKDLGGGGGNEGTNPNKDKKSKKSKRKSTNATSEDLLDNVQTSRKFLAVTNHDRAMEGWSRNHWVEVLEHRGLKGATTGAAHNIMVDSMERKACITGLWKSKGQGAAGGTLKSAENVSEGTREPNGDSDGNKETKEKEGEVQVVVVQQDEEQGEAKSELKLDDIKEWLRTYPLRNETTHFSCIMDPSMEGGGMVWVEACEEV